MKNLNDYVIEDCNEFIVWWNKTILKYGQVTVADVKDTLSDPNNEATYQDSKLGWMEMISTDSFIIRYKITRYKVYLVCQLNLPEAKELY